MAKSGSLMNQMKNKLETRDLRKYVWNDFSIVEKARIQIIKSEDTIGSCIPGDNDELYLECELPVQINPTRFSYKHSINPKSILNRLSTNGQTKHEGFVLHSFGGEYERSPTIIPLIFDIYDEYNARSMNGSMTTNFSLTDEKATSLPLLIQYATDNNSYARFLWGDIAKFGLLTGIEVNYEAFSPWGQPLKAEVNLELTDQYVTGGAKNLNVDGFDMTSIKTTGKKILSGIKNMFR